MQIINIPSFFLLYSAISFFTSILLQSLFHGRKDASANLWIWSCLLSAIATFGTQLRISANVTGDFGIVTDRRSEASVAHNLL
jgi:phosphoglycerol transferase MdoB-like AlkP superfamily enzyme